MAKSRLSTRIAFCILLVALLPGGAFGQVRDVIRVFAPIPPLGQSQLEQLIEDALPHIDAHVDGPQLQWGVRLETISPTQLAERVRAKEYDVVVMDTSATFLASQGLLIDLGPFVDRTGFSNELLASMRIDGRLFDLPIFRDPMVMIYNRSHFDQHGLRYPHDGWTWDEFAYAAAVISNDHGQEPVYGAALPPKSLLQYILYQGYRELTSVDDSNLRYALSIVSTLVDSGALLLDSYGSDPHFGRGTVGMQFLPLSMALLQTTWTGARTNGIDWGIAPLPVSPDKAAVNLDNTTRTVGIPINAPNPGAAWEVATLLASEGHRVLGGPMDLPAYIDAEALDAWIDHVLPNALPETKDDLRRVLTRPNSAFGRGSLEANHMMNGELSTQLQLLMTGMTTSDQAFVALQQLRDRLSN